MPRLGCWVDNTTNNTWSVTPESAPQRIAQCMVDGIPEIAMFRLLPITGTNPQSWPEPFWWQALETYAGQRL